MQKMFRLFIILYLDYKLYYTKKLIITKLRKELKKTYKGLRNYYFSVLYKKINLKGAFKPKYKTLKRLKAKNYPYKVYMIQNCRIYTNCVENLSIIKNNQLIPEGSMQQINGKLVNARRNEVLKTGTPKFIKNIRGNVFNLAQGASGYDNYSHWLLDIIPKIKILSEVYSLKKIDYFYFTKLNRFQKETFKVLKLNPNKIINSKIYKHCLIENLFFCTHPNYLKGTISTAHSNIPKWIVDYLRKKFLTSNIKKNLKYKKIYIDRSDSSYNHCKLINDEEIKKYLKNKGFKILKLSKLNFKQQVSIFKNCEIVIGPHGAGMANLIFCKKKTKVLEIKNVGHPNKVYQKISQLNNLEHQFIMLPKILGERRGDMYLPIQRLKNYLN